MNTATLDDLYMRRTLELATLGTGQVAPNPLVGCVIVKDNRIIGEGWHQHYGEAHAEQNAVANVSDPSLLVGSTIYVNLEPCAHFGKTPPCCDWLIEHQVSRVVISNQDPNPLVDGEGISRMQAAGIEVVIGVLEEEGAVLNQEFFSQIHES